MKSPKKLTLAKVTSWTMLGIGSIALLSSIVFVSSILAFVGLGLVFWGALLLYIRNTEYTRKDLLDASILPSLETINKIMRELAYKGNAVYLPPRYFEDPDTIKVYIPKQEDAQIPTPEQTHKHENQLIRNLQGISQGILLIPLGAELSKLFEKTLETNFTRVDLEYLRQNMPKLFIEDLEISQSFEMEAADNRVVVRVGNTSYNNLFKDTRNASNNHCILGSPISSAIACALAKATGKPVTIENQQTSEDGEYIVIEYQILEDEKTE